MYKTPVTFIYSCFCFSALIYLIQGKKYRIGFEDEEIVTPCDEHPDNFLSNYIDMSQLNFELLEDDNVHVTGKCVFLKDMPNVPIKVSAQVFKKIRGEWVSTIYNLHREDLCFSLFNSAEFWYQAFKNIPEESRVCPPKKDFSFDVDITPGLVIDVAERKGEGEYKIEVNIGWGTNPMDFICAKILINSDNV